MTNIISYDKENDILSIHKGFSSEEKFKGNIDAGQVVFDISTKGKIVGIEIMNASKFFKEFNINKQILINTTDVKFNVTKTPDGIVVGILFKSENIEHPAKIAVPLETPRQRL